MLEQIFVNKCDDIISIRLLLKVHLLAKMTLFGIFIVNFFDHMLSKFANKSGGKSLFFQAKSVSKEVL
jgi:hypothetical protein